MRKQQDKIVLLAKPGLNSIKLLVRKPLIDSYISQDKLVLVNNVLREYHDMKEAIKNLKDTIKSYF